MPLHGLLHGTASVLRHTSSCLPTAVTHISLLPHLFVTPQFRSPRVLWNAECLEGILQNDMLVKVSAR